MNLHTLSGIDVKKMLTPKIKNVKKTCFYEKNKKTLKNV